MADTLDNLRQRSVEDAVMVLSRSRQTIPVASIVTQFVMDDLPQATVIPAFGAVFGRPETVVSIANLSLGEPADLYLTLDGKRRKIFSGYVQQVSPQSTGTMFARSLSASIVLQHITSMAAGPAPASYIYTQTTGQSLQTLLHEKGTENLFFPVGNPKFKDMEPVGNTLQMLQERIKNDAAKAGEKPVDLRYASALLMRMFVVALLEQFQGGLTTGLKLDEIFREYTGARMQMGIARDGDVIQNTILNRWKNDWESQNCWQALISTAVYMFLHTLPFADGLYIADPLALYRTPAIKLTEDDYIGFSPQIANVMLAPVDGVILRPPTGMDPDSVTDVWLSWPPNLSVTAPLSPGKWYYWRELPEWAVGLADSYYGPYKAPTDTSRATTVEDKEKEAASRELAANCATVGAAIAKLYCSELKMGGRSAVLQLPYREDIMPGVLLEIDARGSQIAFLGDILYGMVTQTTFSCSNLNNDPDLHLEVRLTLLRNKKANDDDNLTLTAHPLYEKPWPGMTLFGELLNAV